MSRIKFDRRHGSLRGVTAQGPYMERNNLYILLQHAAQAHLAGRAWDFQVRVSSDPHHKRPRPASQWHKLPMDDAEAERIIRASIVDPAQAERRIRHLYAKRSPSTTV